MLGICLRGGGVSIGHLDKKEANNALCLHDTKEFLA
jgi:hypothetical protein